MSLETQIAEALQILRIATPHPSKCYALKTKELHIIKPRSTFDMIDINHDKYSSQEPDQKVFASKLPGGIFGCGTTISSRGYVLHPQKLAIFDFSVRLLWLTNAGRRCYGFIIAHITGRVRAPICGLSRGASEDTGIGCIRCSAVVKTSPAMGQPSV